MTKYESQWNSIPPYVTELMKNIGYDLKAAQSLADFNEDEWGPLFSIWVKYNTKYGGSQDAGSWQYNIKLAFDAPSGKRDLIKRGGRCGLLSSPSSSISNAASAITAPASTNAGGTSLSAQPSKSSQTTSTLRGTKLLPSSTPESPSITPTPTATLKCLADGAPWFSPTRSVFLPVSSISRS